MVECNLSVCGGEVRMPLHRRTTENANGSLQCYACTFSRRNPVALDICRSRTAAAGTRSGRLSSGWRFEQRQRRSNRPSRRKYRNTSLRLNTPCTPTLKWPVLLRSRMALLPHTTQSSKRNFLMRRCVPASGQSQILSNRTLGGAAAEQHSRWQRQASPHEGREATARHSARSGRRTGPAARTARV